MNGPHDLGGAMGFGPVEPEADEPPFHGDWEARALAVTLACGALGFWNLDISRHSRERIPPPVYLTSSYYEIWIRALETLLRENGLVGEDELAAGHALHPPKPVKGILKAENVDAVLAKGGPVDRPTDSKPAFKIGDRIRARNLHPTGHTRLPRYVRGHSGIIDAVHGFHVFPDAHAAGGGEAPQWLYSVRFEGAELWGERASHNVMVDLWESYLERT